MFLIHHRSLISDPTSSKKSIRHRSAVTVLNRPPTMTWPYSMLIYSMTLMWWCLAVNRRRYPAGREVSGTICWSARSHACSLLSFQKVNSNWPSSIKSTSKKTTPKWFLALCNSIKPTTWSNPSTVKAIRRISRRILSNFSSLFAFDNISFRLNQLGRVQWRELAFVRD